MDDVIEIIFADVNKYKKFIYQMKALSKTNRLVPISEHFKWKPENYYSFCHFLENHSPNKVLLFHMTKFMTMEYLTFDRLLNLRKSHLSLSALGSFI